MIKELEHKKIVMCPYLCGAYAQFHGQNIIEWSHEIPYPLCIIFNILKITFFNIKDWFN